MKKWILITVLVCLSALSFANEPAQSNQVVDKKLQGTATVKNQPGIPKKEIDASWALTRGAANLCTFWLEIPRAMVLEYNRNNLYGVPTGIVAGTYLAGSRLVYSIFDFAYLGFTGPNAYSANMPEFVWQEQWNPWPKEPQVKKSSAKEMTKEITEAARAAKE